MILSEMVKKSLACVLVLAVVVTNLAVPSVVSAQNWWAPTYEEFNTKVNDTSIPASEIFGERYTHAQVWWVIYSIILFALEHDVSECAAGGGEINDFLGCIGVPQCSGTVTTGCIGDNGQVNGYAFANTKSLGFLEFGKLSDMMLVMKPASGVAYTASALDKIGVPTAYAQQGGFGFNTLSPVLGLWTASRNAAYALVTLAVIVLAFMIMFRMKISPQASVTVQSAIPRVIIGLLLITFSYAIAGFVIDLSYVILGVIAAVVSNPTVSGSDAVGIFNMVNNVGGGIISFGLMVVASVLLGGFASDNFIQDAFAVANLPTSVGSAILVAILVLILIIIAVVRIFWVFLKTYVMVIFHVVALPFAALGYIASPSSNLFLTLMRSLVGHVSVFVTVSVVVMAAHVLVWTMGGGGAPDLQFLNPYGIVSQGVNGVVDLPGFGGIDLSTLTLFVGSITLLIAPSVANNIKSFIITGRAAREGISLMGIGAAGAAIGGAASLAAGHYTTSTRPGTLGARILAKQGEAEHYKAANEIDKYNTAQEEIRRLQNQAGRITGAAGSISKWFRR